MRVALGVLVAASLAVSACITSSNDFPTGPTYNETFHDTLTVGGFKSHTFSVAYRGQVTVTVTPDTLNTVKTGNVGVGVGQPTVAEPGCNVIVNIPVPIGVSTRFEVQSAPGFICVAIFDVGQMTTDVIYSFRIDHP